MSGVEEAALIPTLAEYLAAGGEGGEAALGTGVAGAGLGAAAGAGGAAAGGITAAEYAKAMAMLEQAAPGSTSAGGLLGAENALPLQQAGSTGLTAGWPWSSQSANAADVKDLSSAYSGAGASKAALAGGGAKTGAGGLLASQIGMQMMQPPQQQSRQAPMMGGGGGGQSGPLPLPYQQSSLSLSNMSDAQKRYLRSMGYQIP